MQSLRRPVLAVKCPRPVPSTSKPHIPPQDQQCQLVDVSFTKAIAPYVLRSNRVQPPSTSAMTGEGYQFLQPEQIHRHRPFPATMLPNVCSTFAICIWASAFASLRSSGVLSSSNSFPNGLPNGVSLPFVGSPSRESIELFHQTRLVRITHGGFAIWLDPFGLLDPQAVVNQI